MESVKGVREAMDTLKLNINGHVIEAKVWVVNVDRSSHVPKAMEVCAMINYQDFYYAMREPLSPGRIAPNSAVCIKDVIFNDPATIVFWTDGTKTVVKAENEPFDKEKGLAMAICKRTCGNKGNYFNVFKKYCHDEEQAPKEDIAYLPKRHGRYPWNEEKEMSVEKD